MGSLFPSILQYGKLKKTYDVPKVFLLKFTPPRTKRFVAIVSLLWVQQSWYAFIAVHGPCCEIFNISGTLMGSKIVDHSDVVGASPIGAAPTTSSFSS